MSGPEPAEIPNRTGAEPAVEVDNLTISYRAGRRDVVVTRGVSFVLPKGRTLGLVGESGSGKSTLARTLLGHLRPGSRIDAGRVMVLGRDVFGLTDRELRELRGGTVAMVAQNAGHALTPSMRVGDQITEALAVHGRPSSRDRLIELARLVRLPNPETIIDRYPHQLSGGQQQRIAIAMAVAPNPQILVLDEPTTALDVITQAAVLALIDDLKQRLRMTVVIVSHDLGVVSAVADTVLVLHEGATVETGPAATLLEAPTETYTRELVAAAPRIHDADGRIVVPEQPADAPELLSCRGIDVRYRGMLNNAVTDFAIQVRRGETIAIVGESGSGKSTIASALVGLAPVEAGSAELNETDTSGADLLSPARKRSLATRRSVQMIFQNADLALNPRRSVGDAIARPLRFFRRSGGSQATRDRVSGLLAEVGLSADFARRVPAQLSGGQRQRVGIARALAADPTLLIADEITTALDVSVQADVLALLDRLRADRELSCLFISHDLAVVRSVSHRVVVMKDGLIVESAPTRELFEDPRHPYTQILLDAVLEPGHTGTPGADLERRVNGLDLSGDLVEVGPGHLVRLPAGPSAGATAVASQPELTG